MRSSRRGSAHRSSPIGSLLDVHFARSGFASKIKAHAAPLVWAETVGPQVSAATEAERVHDGVLYVAVRSAMWASELTFYKNDILCRLNERLGAGRIPAITDIRFQNRGKQRVNKTAKETPPPAHPTITELSEVDVSPREVAAIEASLTTLPEELRPQMLRLRLTDVRLRTWRLDNGWQPCATCGDLAPPRFPADGTVDCARCRVDRLVRKSIPLPEPDDEPLLDELDTDYISDEE